MYESLAELRLDRAYLDGSSRPFAVHDGKLLFEVSPTRAGDTTAKFELVLIHDSGAYHLSGELNLQLPTLSWTIHKLMVTLHLPAVFTYTWTGGSLAPADVESTPTYTYDLPTPGSVLTLAQSLVVGSPPHERVAYAVNLDGNFFR